MRGADALLDAGQRAGQDQDEPRHRPHMDGHRPPPRRLLHRAGQIRFVAYMVIQNVMVFGYHYILYMQYVMTDEWEVASYTAQDTRVLPCEIFIILYFMM